MKTGLRTRSWPLLAVLLAVSCRWPVTLKVGPAPQGMQASVGAWLEQDYAPSIPEAPVLGLIYVSSGASGSGTLQVHRVPDGALPPAGLRPTRPRDALEEPGLYLGTFLPKTGQPRYLARLGGGRRGAG
jgi:hypothetical protein